MTWSELNAKVRPFARGGGGNFGVSAICREPRPGCDFPHWAGFSVARRFSGETITRPSPPFLLVSNGPINVESPKQNEVDELVRWEPDGTFITTGTIYDKFGKPGSSETFKTDARLLLLSVPE